MIGQHLRGGGDRVVVEHGVSYPITIFVPGPIRRNRRSIEAFVIEMQPAVGEKFGRARCRNTALPRPAMRGPLEAVGAPPQPERVVDAARRAAIALALVGEDAAAPERHRHHPSIRRQPAPAGVAGGAANMNGGKRAITHICHISD
ncbi:hypothetical protein J6500_15825 [Bradyrhizobium sp. WSM 1704]|nr:hypothetical protein [Bradyrhizobium semiaridum]